MKSTDAPVKQAVPFGANGSREAITATTPSGSNQASYDVGFPPITMTLKSAGGLPPKGQDMNQILFEQASFNRYFSAGGGYAFDSAFAASIGGYPMGARIPNSTATGFWLNLVEDNSANPENTTSALTGWIPNGSYGSTTVSGLAAASQTLTTLAASKDRIILSGVLTANINIVVPAWVKTWTIVNNCTGSFSVTVKTPSGTGVAIPAGTSAVVYGDGTNINASAAPGTLINTQYFFSNGTYIPSPGARACVGLGVGGGGAGGGTQPTSSAQIASGNGGNGATYGETSKIPVTSSTTISIIVGTPGVPSAGNNGGTGGSTSFGTFIVIPGGQGGGAGAAGGAGTLASDNVSTLQCTGSSVALSIPGDKGTGSFNISVLSNGIKSGGGGDSRFGNGGGGINGTTGPRSGVGYGAGGSGNAAGPGAATNIAGGAGSSGIFMVLEYA